METGSFQENKRTVRQADKRVVIFEADLELRSD